MSQPQLHPHTVAVNDQNTVIEGQKIMKNKKCSCVVDAERCAIHSSSGSGDVLKKANNDSKSKPKKFLRKLKDIRRDNSKCSHRIAPNVLTKQESIFAGTKQNIRKQKCRNNCRYSNKTIPSETTPSKDSLGTRKKSNLVKEAKPGKSQRKSKNSNQIISKSSQKGYKSVNSDFINDAPCTERNATLKGDDTAHDESYRAITPSTSISSSIMNVKRIERAFTSNSNKSKASLTSLTSFSMSENRSITQWLARKSEEKRLQTNTILDEEQKHIEREKKLEREKNFEKWLESKKRQEDAKRIKESRELIETETRKELERAEKNLQNHIRYRAWLMKKQQEEKEKKLHEELRKYQAEIDRKEREAGNKFYQDWLNLLSIAKQKPISSSEGLDSLRSPSSVKYDSAPGIPNKDEDKKRSHTKISEKKYNV